ncbi:hypothetical protein KUCAC02_008711 [Chaenocephalus aceratus]|uniref:Uncharacterized protein n=1 Tax=Chaenocephalus aceratus TaxID=36190 RepID=A0ACB9WS10_CHAAC|nr:hypothetical protein KUCAC02_008711 [Chaenocephalus aceratus]
MEKDGGEELWRLHRLSCWQFKQQYTGSQSPWKGAGGKGGHCQPSGESHKNKSDMNGDIVCNSHSVTVLSCTKSISAVHNEIKLTQEGRCSPVCFPQNDARRLGEGRRTNSISATPKDSKTDFPEMESSYSQCSPCWSDETSSPVSRAPPLQQQQQHPPRPPEESRPPQRRKSTIRIASGKNSQNRKVTDYYPIRRSSRKSKTELQCEEKRHIDDLITKGIEEGMEVQHIEGKGRGVFATRCFQKSEYVVEYHGDLLQITDAKQREAEYALNPATGCYMYYFQLPLQNILCGMPQRVWSNGSTSTRARSCSMTMENGAKPSIAAHPWLKY